MQVALVILDGWGLGDPGARDAVRAADTPTFDALADRGGQGQLTTAGRTVGLPAGQAGNSEVGHLTIGAGRAIPQAFTRIDDAIERGEFAENDALRSALAHVKETGGRLHLLGLISDGGVHSSQEHLHALLRVASAHDVEAVVHAFTDGRDTDPHGGEAYLRELERVAMEYGTGAIATVVGRYFAMDRDENWDRTRRAYEAIVNREAPHTAIDAVSAVEAAYRREESDEFVEPTIVPDAPGIADGDAIVWFNFRADRARQLVRMLADIEPSWPVDRDPPDTHLVTMTEYDETFDFPVAFPPVEPQDTLGDVIAREGLTQLRLAETEKYAHVTYFLNGGREAVFPDEHREIVPSPDVPTYDERPEMSAAAVTDRALDRIDALDPDVLVLNFANPDMVGHTGDFEAAIAAVEAVDTQLGRVANAVFEAEGHLLVTADHGNAEEMGTVKDPHTAHTVHPVPILSCSPGGSRAGIRIRQGGSLTDVAPTILDVLDVSPPDIMTGRTLLE